MNKILWCDKTWNPIVGCSKCSPGCDNCYAEKFARRHAGNHTLPDKTREAYADVITDGKWNGRGRFLAHKLEEPLHWRKPKRIFVCSMTDLFRFGVQEALVTDFLAVVALCPRHTFLMLTKRPERMREHLAMGGGFPGDASYWAEVLGECTWNITKSDTAACAVVNSINGNLGEGYNLDWPMRNLHLGVTVCNQAEADEKIPILLDTPAAVRWVSAEPLLGPLDLRRHLPYLDWIVLGGETGPGARPMHPDWARGIRDQCAEAGVSFFLKNLGEFGTHSLSMPNGEPHFRAFRSVGHWINKARTWVMGGTCIDRDGKVCKIGKDFDEANYPVTVMDRVGKKRAGRDLDGREHDDFPEQGGESE